MSTKFIVEGRHFNKHIEAVTFAQAQAERMGRGVEIKAEMSRETTHVDRRWLATMHPSNFKRPILNPAPKPEPASMKVVS